MIGVTPRNIIRLAGATSSRDTSLVVRETTRGQLIKALTNAKGGEKDGSYIIRGGDLIAPRRADENLRSADIIPIDGDSRFDPETGEVTPGCVPVSVVASVMRELGVWFAIHTTYSADIPRDFWKWRLYLVASRPYSRDELEAIVAWLFDRFYERGVWINNVSENTRWSQPWFLPRCKPEALQHFAFDYESLDAPDLDIDPIVAEYSDRVQKEQQLQQAVERPQLRIAGDDESLIANFNKAQTIESVCGMLESAGYRFVYNDPRAMNGRGGRRYIRPNSESKTAGVVVFMGKDDPLVFSHHGAACPLSGRTSDPFDTYTLLFHNGDKSAAARALMRDYAPKQPSIPEQISARHYDGEAAPVTENSLNHDHKLVFDASYPQEIVRPAIKIQRLILSSKDFVAGFKPPEYLIDGMIQKSYLYALTARTGHGKTAVTMHMAQAVARGVPFHGRGTEQGAVLILAGENPDDVRARYLVLADHCGFKPEDAPVHFIAGVLSIRDSLPQIKMEAAQIGSIALVITDTAQAYFKGTDSNSNAEQLQYAQELRSLTTLPGKPAVLVNCHPTKSAGKDNLYPYGGGSFVNELDGNLTLWSTDSKNTTLHHSADKFRGPGFEPVSFQLETVTSDTVKDAKGRLMPSVIARPIGDLEVIRNEQEGGDDARKLLAIIGNNKNASQVELAKKANWIGATGLPQKSKVNRICQTLREDKLVKVVLGKYRITALGKRELGWGDGDDD